MEKGALVVSRHYRPGRHLVRTSVIAALGTALMGIALVVGSPNDADWTAAGHWLRIGWLALAVVVGLIVYAVVVLAAGVRPRDLRHRA